MEEETVSLIKEDISNYMFAIFSAPVWKNTLNLSLTGTFAQISNFHLLIPYLKC